MKLNEIKNIKSLPGTYAGMRFSKDTIKNIKKIYKLFDINNPVEEKELHTTLLYSTKHLPDYKELGKLDEIMIGKSINFDLWEDKHGDDPKFALVLKFKSTDLVDRHKYLMKKHNAKWNHPSYIPHLTLSYDARDVNLKELNKYIKENPLTIEMVKEYQNELNQNYT